MLKFLQRLLGWDPQDASATPEDTERRRTPWISAASILTDGPQQAAGDSPPAEGKKTAEVPEPALSLDDPDIGLEKPDVDGSNPYDTGKFNKPNVWSNAGGRKNN
jgi:hypothetical protein